MYLFISFICLLSIAKPKMQTTMGGVHAIRQFVVDTINNHNTFIKNELPHK